MSRENKPNSLDLGISDDFEHRVGPEQLEYIPLSSIIVLPQIRQHYDPEAVEALQKALDSHDKNPDSRLSVQLIHPPTIDVLDEQQFVKFLKDHADYYGVEALEPNAFAPGPSGYYFVAISGNTRTVTIRRMCSDVGVGEDTVGMKCSLVLGKDFYDANRDQARENTYEKPSDHDEARNILCEYKYRQSLARRYGRPRSTYSYAEIASHFGCSVDKVSKAIKYSQLPEDLKALVVKSDETLVTYNVALALHPYMLAYARNKGLYFGDANVKDAVLCLASEFMNKKLSCGTNATRFKEIIQGHINDLQRSHSITDQALFIVESSPISRDPRKARVNGARKLAGTALGALEYAALTPDAMTPELAERIYDLAAKIGARTVASEVEEDAEAIDLVARTEALF